MSSQPTKGLRIAIPKGSMEARIDELLSAYLAKCNQSIKWRGYVGSVEKGLEIDSIIKMRPQDAPIYVARGDIDACITGQDCLEEQGFGDELIEIAKIPISRAGNSSVWIIVFVTYDNAPWVNSKLYKSGIPIKVVTEYPNITERYFREKGLNVSIDVCHGATEAIVASGLATLGVDVIDSGNTLGEHGLIDLDIVMKSSAVLVTRQEVWDIPSARSCLQNFADTLLA